MLGLQSFESPEKTKSQINVGRSKRTERTQDYYIMTTASATRAPHISGPAGN